MQIIVRAKRFSWIPILIALNAAVYFLWFVVDDFVMLNNFTVSWQSLQEQRYWVLLSAAFSHNILIHILINMLVLKSFGGIIEDTLGAWTFIRFYLVAAVMSSIAHASISAFLVGEPAMPALGASGAIAGVILLFSMLYPREKILILGLIPVPAFFGAVAFIGLDIWGLTAQAGGGGLPIGHGAHLGGSLTGIVYFLILRRRRVY